MPKVESDPQTAAHHRLSVELVAPEYDLHGCVDGIQHRSKAASHEARRSSFLDSLERRSKSIAAVRAEGCFDDLGVRRRLLALYSCLIRRISSRAASW